MVEELRGLAELKLGMHNLALESLTQISKMNNKTEMEINNENRHLSNWHQQMK